ncbi:MAG: cytochrome c oxidase assembly protein [Gemmatimonadaceae bacterium]
MGEPVRGFIWAFPRSIRASVPARWMRSAFWRRIAAFLTAPTAAFALHAMALLMWHLPGPYDAARRSETVHAFEHVSFLGTALMFWWVVLAPAPFRRLQLALRLPYVVAMSLVGAAIGAVLTFASSPFYEAYLTSAPHFGFTALEDQQLAGLIMWIPGGLAYLIAAAALFVTWINGADARADRISDLRMRPEAG